MLQFYSYFTVICYKTWLFWSCCFLFVTAMIKLIVSKCDAISGGAAMIKLRWYYPSPSETVTFITVSCHLLPAFIQNLQEQRQLSPFAGGIPSAAAVEAAVKGFQAQQKMSAAALLMTNKELTVGLVSVFWLTVIDVLYIFKPLNHKYKRFV